MFTVFLSSCSNTCESLGELEKAVKTLACRLVFPRHFYQTSTRVSIKQLDYVLKISITHINRERII